MLKAWRRWIEQRVWFDPAAPVVLLRDWPQWWVRGYVSMYWPRSWWRDRLRKLSFPTLISRTIVHFSANARADIMTYSSRGPGPHVRADALQLRDKPVDTLGEMTALTVTLNGEQLDVEAWCFEGVIFVAHLSEPPLAIAVQGLESERLDLVSEDSRSIPRTHTPAVGDP